MKERGSKLSFLSVWFSYNERQGGRKGKRIYEEKGEKRKKLFFEMDAFGKGRERERERERELK